MYMFKYICKRVGLMIMTFLIIFVTCFVLIKLLPFDDTAGFGQDTDKIRAQFAARGYYDPIPKQFVQYLRRIFMDGDFGIGFRMPEYRGRDVWDVFVEKLPATILINVYSSLIAIPIGIGLGIFAALKKNKWQDHVISTGVMVLVSVPSYVYAFLIQYFLCYKLDLFPLHMKPGGEYFTWATIKSMLPAVISLSLSSIAGYARFTRAELTEVLTSDYLLLARTKGLTRAQTTTRHALRNAMVPIFPSILTEVVAVLSGSLIIESIFEVPGVGPLYTDSITALDYNFFLLLSAFYTLIGLTAGIVMDLSYGIIDPRIRMGSKK